MGETKDLDLKHDISDTEVLAIAAALATVQVVQKVDLHGNALVSDKAIGQLLQRPAGAQAGAWGERRGKTMKKH